MPSSAPQVAIATVQLCKRYGAFTALDRLDLSVARGRIFGLLGPNGAGKSTTIRILTTLLDASSGSATVVGFDVAREPVEVRRRIGYVPQLLSADGALTASENLVLSARLYGLHGRKRVARVNEALAFAGLAPVANHLVRTFSGGMVRRLEIAQATLHRPEVLWLAVFGQVFGQVLTMPLFFASNALYPLELMPGWLRAIAMANPLSYLVDALRGAMIVGGTSVYPWSTSFAVLLCVFALLLALASKLYPGLAR